MTISHVHFVLSVLAASAAAQKSPINANPADTSNPILVGKRFPFNQIPHQADTSTSERGTQFGFNDCGTKNASQDTNCQTAIINSLDDFCLWGPPKPGVAIGDSESFEVAWCTKPTHGARLIPAGALTGVQFIKTPSYVQVTGHINQVLVNLPDGDTGGELDSGGQDGRGNPIGALVYSSTLPGGTAQLPVQAASWHNFIGGNTFCFKACDPNAANAVGLCQHIYDRIGCAYNAPADYTDGVFLSCQGDDQDPVGIFTGADGVVSTYKQPAESLGPISSMPYQPKVPATSNCVTSQSAQLYAGLPTVAGPSTTPPSSPTNTPPAGGTGPSGSKPTGGSGSGTDTGNGGGNGASGLAANSLAAILLAALTGVAYAA